MAEVIINGPVVRDGVHNVVLRDALFHSPVRRDASQTSYYTITVGIREGEYTSWVGTWTQETQSIEGGAPTSILDSGRAGMRLKADQAVVVKVDSSGTPANLKGAGVRFILARVGGRDGNAKPLVSTGTGVVDPSTRAAIQALRRQINSGGLAEWEENVQLQDPAPQTAAGTFQGRIQRDSDTSLSLQQYGGNWIEVNGQSISLSADGFSLTTSDGILATTGGVTATTPSSSTLYGVYVSSFGIRLGSSTPVSYLGVYYLGTEFAAREWRFCGWAYLNGSTQFSDSDIERHVVNYYNRERKRLYRCPDYTDDDAATTMTTLSSATWTQVNGDVDADVSFVANGEDAVYLSVHMRAEPSVASKFGCAIGIDGITDIETAAVIGGTGSTDRTHLSTERVYAPASAGQHTGEFLGVVTSGNLTIYADDARNGATADPAVSYLVGHLMA